MRDACADIILGQSFLKSHESVVFTFGGKEDTITIGTGREEKCASLACTAIKPPRLFAHLQDNCKPIATRSRSYSHEDQKFI